MLHNLNVDIGKDTNLTCLTSLSTCSDLPEKGQNFIEFHFETHRFHYKFVQLSELIDSAGVMKLQSVHWTKSRKSKISFRISLNATTKWIDFPLKRFQSTEIRFKAQATFTIWKSNHWNLIVRLPFQLAINKTELNHSLISTFRANNFFILNQVFFSFLQWTRA